MTIQQLKTMTSRELASFFANVKRGELVEILKSESLGGYSKLNKASLTELVLDLVEGIVTELTKILKPLKPRKQVDEEVKMYREMTKKCNYRPTVTDTLKSSYSLYFKNNEELDIEKSLRRDKYIKLAKYYHPDKPTGNVEKFRIIQESYQDAKYEINEVIENNGELF